MSDAMLSAPPREAATAAPPRTVKCVVWDLDDTVWDGVLLEGDAASLRPGVEAVIRGLDERGILQSIASRNDEAAALGRLRALGLDEFFLHPQIHWGSKAGSVAAIAEALNIGIDALAFIDDQPFERAEVAHRHPGVLCIDAVAASALLDRPEFRPRFVTPESRLRRHMYRSDIARDAAEAATDAPKEAFLRTLGMVYTIAEATRDDLQRAEELTQRTNQLNSTGLTFSYDELDALRTSPRHRLLVTRLEDRFGSYGTIGLALVEQDYAGDAPPAPGGTWTLKLLLMSCRVMARGVGAVLMDHVLREARDAGVAVRAELVETGRNRPMQLAYMVAGFREIERAGDRVVLGHDLAAIRPVPDFVDLRLA